MTDRILLHAHANENTIQFRTVSARMKSPQQFYVTYSELDRPRPSDGGLTLGDTVTADNLHYCTLLERHINGRAGA